ncbi:hypothetical protein [Nesterenkonia sphaerica]|uniref:PQQ-like beta-propeller repeat protein n=1 Tax=Nesterenkonia sphaerica TaxID=1804988 RepID=A0A5R9AJY1_9MICC|nr:hypothetical protein [Nesterenkonia sphaerica]TLP78991.1 hypothetical protein FEF27_03830 [Nesterenkonia sphaerica]
MNMKRSLLSLALLSSLVLSACGDTTDDADQPDDADAEATGADDGGGEEGTENEDEETEELEETEPVEPSDRETRQVGGPEPRLVVTHDGGVAVLDGVSTELLGNFAVEASARVSEAGDGRHAFIAEEQSFRLLDVGTWGAPHGDHNDYFTTDPVLTDTSIEGESAAHMSSHGRMGTVFFDGSGEYHWFQLEDLDAETELETESAESEGTDEGLAVVLDDGSRVHASGADTDARVVDADGEERARSQDCPGIEGQASGPEGVLVLGCEDGVLVWTGDDFEKIETGEERSGIGHLVGSEESPVFLGDYRTAEDGPMTEVALVNTSSGEITTTSVDVSYEARNLQRGPDGEALVLTDDGQLHIIDADSGEHLEHLQVVEEWTQAEGSEVPSPTIGASGDLVYVTDPEARQIHIVDLTEGEVIVSGDLDFVPNDFVVVDGRPIEGVSEEYDGDHEDHGHEDHDHDDHGHDDEHDHGHDNEEHGHDEHGHDDHHDDDEHHDH